jgi:DNA-binding transcriptional LysR family regulator
MFRIVDCQKGNQNQHMKPRYLSTATRYFLEVARTGSVTLAAGQLHVASSAVSRQIAQLEAQMGLVLFERRGRGLVLSSAGERLAAGLRHTVLELQRLTEDLHGSHLQVPPTLRLACTEGFTSGFMADVMGAFRRRHPDCGLVQVSTSPEGVSRLLLSGDVDVGLKFSVAPEVGLRIEHQQPAPIWLLCAPGHPVAQARQPTLAEVVRHPVAMAPPGTTVRQLVELVFNVEGLRVYPAFTGDFATLLALAARGEAVVFSSALGAAHLLQRGELVALSLPELALHQRGIQILTSEKAEPGGPMRTLLEFLIATTQALGTPPPAQGTRRAA